MSSTRSLEALKLQLVAASYKTRVGARIRSARKAKNWKQRDLAYALPGRVDGPTISRWERGMVMPHPDTLEALAKALDVDPSYFLVTDEVQRDMATPDPFARSSDPGDQLDRIEGKLDRLLAGLEPLLRVSPPGEDGMAGPAPAWVEALVALPAALREWRAQQDGSAAASDPPEAA